MGELRQVHGWASASLSVWVERGGCFPCWLHISITWRSFNKRQPLLPPHAPTLVRFKVSSGDFTTQHPTAAPCSSLDTDSHSWDLY